MYLGLLNSVTTDQIEAISNKFLFVILPDNKKKKNINLTSLVELKPMPEKQMCLKLFTLLLLPCNPYNEMKYWQDPKAYLKEELSYLGKVTNPWH